MIKELEITDTIQDIVDEYENYRESGWRYLIKLRDAVDTYARTDPAKMTIYQSVASQINRSVKTLQNKVSIARKTYSQLAYDLGLEFEHVAAVAHLDDPEAEALLHEAAENFLDPSELGYIAKKRYSTSPDNGNSATPTADAAERFLSDDEPPYNDNAMYTDEPASLDRMPVTKLADYIRREYDDGEIAALIDALLR